MRLLTHTIKSGVQFLMCDSFDTLPSLELGGGRGIRHL